MKSFKNHFHIDLTCDEILVEEASSVDFKEHRSIQKKKEKEKARLNTYYDDDKRKFIETPSTTKKSPRKRND